MRPSHFLNQHAKSQGYSKLQPWREGVNAEQGTLCHQLLVRVVLSISLPYGVRCTRSRKGVRQLSLATKDTRKSIIPVYE